ncbi:MAG: hypothetical protein AAFY60_20335, partial [Myxococcota bacterium]
VSPAPVEETDAPVQGADGAAAANATPAEAPAQAAVEPAATDADVYEGATGAVDGEPAAADTTLPAPLVPEDVFTGPLGQSVRRALTEGPIEHQGAFASRWGDIELMSLRARLEADTGPTLQFVADRWDSFAQDGQHERPTPLQRSITEIARSHVRSGDASDLQRGAFVLGTPPWDRGAVERLQREPPDTSTFSTFAEVVSALPEADRAHIATTLAAEIPGDDRAANDRTLNYLLPLSDQLDVETVERIAGLALGADETAAPSLDPALVRSMVVRAASAPSEHRERLDALLGSLGISERDRAGLVGYAAGELATLDGVELSEDAQAALDGARLGRSAEETLAEYGVPSPGVVLGAIEATEDYDATRLREELG